MDGVSIAASIIGIATAGAQVSIKLVTLASQISNASDRVSAIGNDISLTSNVLRQLGGLMPQKTTDAGISILSEEAIETTKTAAAMCEKIFSEIEKEVKRASEQLRRYKPGLGKMRGQKIELSKTEKAKWPFLQPSIDGLRAELRDAKSTLILLLQVATLALNKRVADAPMPANELLDSFRAVVAVELERREGRTNPIEPPEVLSSSSSIKSTEIGIPNITTPRRKTLSLENNQSRGLQPGIISNLSVANSPGLDDFPTVEHAASERGNQTQRTHNSELQLLLLKPLVEDLHDRIQLRWTVQDTKMQPLAIREYMDKNEKDEIPSLIEMLQQLHTYEQEIVDAQMPKASGRSVVSLKRTTTDIRSRDMLFKAVPGLQFVVQCHARQSQPFGKQASVTHDDRPDLPPVPDHSDMSDGGSMGRGAYDTTGEPKPKPPPKPVLEERRAKQRPLRQEDLVVAPKPSTFDDESEGDFEPEDIGTSSQDEAVPNEEAEAEAMVNGLLKQYTTLFDS